MDPKNKLSVVIVSYNTKKLLSDCIKSVEKHFNKINYEIIVVDNNSSDGSQELVNNYSKKINNIFLIKNSKNIGFAAANNKVLKKIRSKYILLLNSDTIVESDFIKYMLEWMDTNTDVGISSCMLKNKDGSIQETGGYFPTLTKIFFWMLFIDDIPVLDKLIKPFHPFHSRSFCRNIQFYKNIQNLDWVSGAFFLIRKEVVADIGYIDERYFMYMEDVDYCRRAKSKGWNIKYNPKWSITHFGGASSAKEYPIVSEFKGIKIYYHKHMSKLIYPIVLILLKIGALLRIAVYFVLEGKEGSDVYKKAYNQI